MSRAGAVLAAAAVCAGGVVARDRLARWGATDAEVFGELPGDEFVLSARRSGSRPRSR